MFSVEEHPILVSLVFLDQLLWTVSMWTQTTSCSSSRGRDCGQLCLHKSLSELLTRLLPQTPVQSPLPSSESSHSWGDLAGHSPCRLLSWNILGWWREAPGITDSSHSTFCGRLKVWMVSAKFGTSVTRASGQFLVLYSSVKQHCNRLRGKVMDR